MEKRINIVWHTLRHPVRWALKLLYNYTTPSYDIKGPVLVLSNHVTDIDPLMVGAAFNNPLHFVASEHIFRLGFVSKLIIWLVAPIARQKGGSAAGTVKNMLRTLKSGSNVAIFPEGNRCWDGNTRKMIGTIGKVARVSGATLVTFRMRGGYLTSPRWSGNSRRRGRMRGEIVNIYKPEQLAAMSVPEINRLIETDLNENAYETQRAELVEYKGKNLAEHLETLLFVCPKCGAKHALKSSGDRFSCTACGMETVYTPQGFFSGGDLPFDDVARWDEWQSGIMREMCESAAEEAIFTDSDILLRRIHTATGTETLGTGELALYKDRLEMPTQTIPLSEISGMSLRGAGSLFVGTKDGTLYELRSEGVKCMVKYLDACVFLGCPVEYGI